jgi:hypothetical protein
MYEIKESEIHGKGVHATQTIQSGRVIDVCIIKDQFGITLFGAKLNHSPNANGDIVKIGDDWYVEANKSISLGEEITVNYWNTPDFILKPPALGISD